MATYILVSGAWHAGWCWERVVPLLEAAGHHVIAPDLLGMGNDKMPLRDITLDLWAEQVAEIIRRLEEKVILVGHSRAGIVISEVAQRMPDKIETLVYLAAFLVPNGKTLIETTALVPRNREIEVIIRGPEGTTTVNPDAIRPVFYNLTQPEWVAKAEAQLSPEPMAPWATPLQIDGKFGSVRRAYIECVHDNAVTLDLQRAMQAQLPCYPVFTPETDHSPFYSAPDRLVRCLLQISRAQVPAEK